MAKTIKFRNGVAVQVDYAQFVMLRDWFEHLRAQSFAVEKADEGYVIVSLKNPWFKFQTNSILTVKPFFEFLELLTYQGWSFSQTGNNYRLNRGNIEYTVEQLDTNLYRIEGKVKILGPVETLMVYFFDCLAGLYDNDYQDKIVLDIGGFCGETAVYFSSMGAAKVIIYEPVLAHHNLIKQNMVANSVNAEIHEEGIGEKTCSKTIRYDSLNVAFGLTNSGQNETTIKLRNISETIIESKADIAKIDCEGAEISLTNISPDTLRKISFYFIETHTPEIQKAITKKYLESGFMMARQPAELSKDIAMLYFKRAEMQ
jgi:FkbM family methyltransferase